MEIIKITDEKELDALKEIHESIATACVGMEYMAKLKKELTNKLFKFLWAHHPETKDYEITYEHGEKEIHLLYKK